MMSARISPFVWRCLVFLCAIGIGLMLQSELRIGLGERLVQGQGSLGVTLADRTGVRMEGLGTHWLRITHIDKDTYLSSAGVRAGDRLHFDRPLDRWRRFAPGEQVPLSVNGREIGPVPTVAQPISARERGDYLGRALIAWPALAFAVLIALRLLAGRRAGLRGAVSAVSMQTSEAAHVPDGQ
jgi:hypothetical protein